MTPVFRAVLAAAFLAGAAPAALSAAPPAGELTAVRITSAPGRVDFVMQVQGAVRVSDFYLADPDRLVLDVAGATLRNGQVKLYDGVTRGGITNVRYSQFKPGVVRIVLDLQAPRPYSIEQQGDLIRVSFSGESPNFQAWASDALHCVIGFPPLPNVSLTSSRTLKRQVGFGRAAADFAEAPSGLRRRQLLEPTGNSFDHTVSFVSLVRTAMTEAPLTL